MNEDLAWYASYFVSFVDTSPAKFKPLMLDSLFAVFHRIRAVAFEQAGYGRNRGEGRDLWRFKVLYITGEPLDGGVQCIGNTKMGVRCRNRPYVGGQHCHAHASDQEKQVNARNNEAWNKEYGLVLEAAGLERSASEVIDRINLIKEALSAKDV